MQVLIANTSDVKGGAARAAYRLHQGLQEIGVDSKMLVQTKQSSDLTVVGPKAGSGIGQVKTGLKLILDQLPLKRYKNYNGTTFSPQWVPDQVGKKVSGLNPDVINLHWVNAGFVHIETVARFNKPIVWTLHDMWPFTGGCHYTQTCDRYQNSCGACPQLGSQKESDLSRRIWQRKAKAFEGINLTVVTPSHWLKDCAQESSLFKGVRVECIPNSLDASIYAPFDKGMARKALNLPQDKQLVLFGSIKATSDKRKGFHLLQAALQEFSHSELSDHVELVVFGASKPDAPPEFGLKAHYLGSFNDDLSLRLVYSASDVFVMASIQENLANTVMESLACGTPCVGFKIGGIPDLIEHQTNGYLAEAYEINDLAKGIAWVLRDPLRHESLAQRAREKVETEFTLKHQANRYCSLFESI